MMYQSIRSISAAKVLIGIVLLASFLRLWQLPVVPPSPSLDEVSIGYNAYSILKTGRDEYGQAFPLVLRAYDDYRPALYVYLVIPFVALFGLTAYAVRLPSVLLGIGTVVAVFFLMKALVLRSTNTYIKEGLLFLPTVVSGLLAISPWHIYLSRLGHEVNLGFATLIFALLFLLRSKPGISLIFFTLSFMSYQSEKIVVPFVIAGSFLFMREQLLKKKTETVIGIVLSCIVLIPFLSATLVPDALVRFDATNVLTANDAIFYSRAVDLKNAKEQGEWFGQIIHNRRVVAAEIIGSQFFSHFNLRWLLMNSGAEPHKVPDFGLFHVWEAVFIGVGIFVILNKQVLLRKDILVLGIWLIASILPAAITTQAPHAMRSFTMLPVFLIVEAFGLYVVWKSMKRFRKIILSAGAIIVIVSLVQLSYYYFRIFPQTQSDSFQYALGKAIPEILAQEANYGKIVLSNQGALYQSYMFYLFYSKFDPALYQLMGGTGSGGYAEPHRIGKYEFRPIVWNSERKGDSILYVGNDSEFPSGSSYFAVFSNRASQSRVFLKED